MSQAVLSCLYSWRTFPVCRQPWPSQMGTNKLHGVYLGHSPFHAGSVALVFNPRTGQEFLQCHMIFDDTFLTLPYMHAGNEPPHWHNLLKYSSKKATYEDFNLAEVWMNMVDKMPDRQRPLAASLIRSSLYLMDNLDTTNPTGNSASSSSQTPFATAALTPSQSGMQASEGGNTCASAKVNLSLNAAVSSSSKSSRDDFCAQVTTDPSSLHHLLMLEHIILHDTGLCWFPRLQEQTDWRKEKAHIAWVSKSPHVIILFTLFLFISDYKVTVTSYALSPNASNTDWMVSCTHELNELYDGMLSLIVAYAFSTVALDVSNNEVCTYTKAIQQPNADKFINAMRKEINDHESCDHWEFFCRTTIPQGMKTIQAIWSFKCKRFPDGTLNKHKAWFCGRGGMQQWGVSYWETYSLVVNMLTVWLLLALCNIHGLHLKSINFFLAFPQADLDMDIWMELPMGIVVDSCALKSHGYGLKLKKSLYVLKQAGLNWFEKLKQGLTDRGFCPSEIDPSCNSSRTWFSWLM